MKNVDIEIFCIAQTRVNQQGMRDWLDRCGAHKTPVPRVKSDPTAILEPEVTDAGAVCALCAKRCYMAFEAGLNPNVTKIRKVWYDYLNNILASGHGSVFEHATWTFAIEGVSRVFTGEMNRHRAGVAISEGSMRYIRFDDIAFWMPKSLDKGNYSLMPTRKCDNCKGKPETIDDRVGCGICAGTGHVNLLTDEEYRLKQKKTIGRLHTVFSSTEEDYRYLCDLWGIEKLKDFNTKKKLTSLFRRIVPMGVATGGTWTFNARALRHILALRSSPHAEEEIAYVMSLIGKWIVESEPEIFGDFELVNGFWVPKWEKV